MGKVEEEEKLKKEVTSGKYKRGKTSTYIERPLHNGYMRYFGLNETFTENIEISKMQ
jgi:hypothetical protein